MLVSVLINNFNYGRFLGNCIDSALAQTYTNIEIIVVDDGSTDDSTEVLDRYRESVTIVWQANGGQGAAYNTGYAKSCGDVVIFLDADDVLAPGVLAQAVAEFSDDSVAKVQWRLQVIDDRDQPGGGVFPDVLHSGSVTDIIQKFGIYGSPPGSGNAFRRSAIEPFFPINKALWRIAADTVPVVVAPFSGKVVTLSGIGGGYRIHDKPEAAGAFVLNNSPAKPAEAVRLANQCREQVFDLLLKAQLIVQPFKFEMPAQVKLRLICRKALPDENPVQGDSLLKILADAFSSVCRWPGFNFRKRLLYALWFLSVAVTPTELAKKIILRGLRYSRSTPAKTDQL